MRLCSFQHRGKASFGIIVDDGIVDVRSRLKGMAACLAEVLDRLELLEPMLSETPDLSLAEVKLLPPIPEPRKIIGIGINYRAHIKEAGVETPRHPMLFARFSDSVVGHGAPVILPRISTKFDFECELAVVIGKGGRHIAKAEALDHVAGYSCFNDGSIRDWQFHTTQVMAGKTFWRSGSFGPWIVTRDEFGDIGDQGIMTRLNGEQMQISRLNDLVFGVEDLIAYISSIAPLSPGDVIATGTPGGVGLFRKPRVWLKPGDQLEFEIEGIGILANSVTAEA